MCYGRNGDRWYVNSAQSWSRDRVDETFPDAAILGLAP